MGQGLRDRAHSIRTRTRTNAPGIASAVLDSPFTILAWWLSGSSVHILTVQMLTTSQIRLLYPSIVLGSKSTSPGHSRSEFFELLGSTDVILSFSAPQLYRAGRIVTTMSSDI